MNKLIGFGETVPGYHVAVVNEREVRAAAGILFFFAMVAFTRAFLLGDFRMTQVFVVAFLIDFTIRIFINPRFSPSLILGRFAVRKQVPEWTGAPQKRFAWLVGWLLAAVMFYLIVLNQMIGPVNMLVCGTCLLLMFFETAFGICVACKIYNAFTKQQAQYCPGGACEVFTPHASQKVGAAGTAIVVAFLALVVVVGKHGLPVTEVHAAGAPAGGHAAHAVNSGADERCTPPAFAVAMGHAEMWKLHNNCK